MPKYKCRLCKKKVKYDSAHLDSLMIMEQAQKVCRDCSMKGLEFDDILKWPNGTPIGMVHMTDAETGELISFEYTLPISHPRLFAFGVRYISYKINGNVLTKTIVDNWHVHKDDAEKFKKEKKIVEQMD